MSDKRSKSADILNGLVALLIVLVAGILLYLIRMEPVDLAAGAVELGMRAVAPYKGNAADGVTTVVNSMLVGGKTYTGGAQSFRTDTDGALYIIPAGPSTVTLLAGDPLPITPAIGSVLEVTQATPDDLNTNANLQYEDADVTVARPLPVGGSLEITTSEDLTVTLDGEQITVADIITGEQNIGTVINDVPMVPFQPISRIGPTELVGINEQMAQFEYSDATEIALGCTCSGEFLGLTGIFSGTLTEAATFLVFASDPSISLGDANMPTASWPLVIIKYDVAAGDWHEEDSGGTGAMFYSVQPGAFDELTSVWIVVYWEGGTTVNSLAGDNEKIDVGFWFRQDS